MRPRFHFSVPDHWMNDPQRPLWLQDRWHYWYLYNADYGEGAGTAWRHATSTDLVTWQDQGVAIDKGTTPNGDVWSGSVVVDEQDTAGQGAGTLLALLTQPDHAHGGAQAQFLWRSHDDGHHFLPVGDGPVLANPGLKDFRDPKLVRDQERGRWVCLVAQGERIGIWRSRDLRSWRHSSDFVPPPLGTLECPDLFRITAHDGTSTWVLGCGANGSASGQPTTYAYWTGTFDGTRFLPDRREPRWLDHGFDYYGAVTFDSREGPGSMRHAIGWMNNWRYPDATPTWPGDGFNGVDSVVREVRCRRGSDGLVLTSTPVPTLAARATGTRSLPDATVDGSLRLDLSGVAYRLDVDLSWDDATNIGLRLRVSDDGSRHVDVGICGDYSYLNRGSTHGPDPTLVESRAPFTSARRAHLTVLVDLTSVELFVDDGEVVHTSQVFAPRADRALEAFTVGGPARFAGLRLTSFE